MCHRQRFVIAGKRKRKPNVDTTRCPFTRAPPKRNQSQGGGSSYHLMSIRRDDRHIPKLNVKVESPHGSRPLRKKIQETHRSETPNKVVKPRPQSKPDTKKPQVNQNDTTRCLYIPKKDLKQAAQNDRRSVRKENCCNQDII